jgi:replicative DNA helicase
VHARTFNEVAEFLTPEDFYHPALKAIFESMTELERNAKPIDALTVAEQMRGAESFDKLRAFGGADYLTELMAKVVTVENIG